MSRNRNSNRKILEKNVKAETKSMTVLKWILRWFLVKEQRPLNLANTQFNSLSLGHFDLSGRNRNLCHYVATTGNTNSSNNCSPRIHYVVKSYYSNEIRYLSISCFAFTRHTLKKYDPGQNHIKEPKSLFFQAHALEPS